MLYILVFFVHVLGQGEGEDKFAALSFRADDVDMFLVAVDDLFYNGKAQAGAFFVPASGEVGFVESVPDQFQRFFWDADSGIFYRDKKFAFLDGCLHFDNGIVVAELDGIVQEVVENLLDFAHVCVDIQFCACEDKLDGDGLPAAGAFEGGGGAADDAVDLEICPIQEHSCGVQVVQGQEAVGEFGQAFCFVQHNVQVFVVGFHGDGAVDHGLQITSDGGEGGTEVVGDVGHKFLLVVLRACNLACHVIQAGRQVADLVVALHLEFIVHIAVGILFRGIGDFAQGNVHDLRKKDQDDQGQQQQDHQGDIGDVQKAVAEGLDLLHIAVDYHIAFYHIVIGDGGEDGENILVKAVKKIVYHVV